MTEMTTIRTEDFIMRAPGEVLSRFDTFDHAGTREARLVTRARSGMLANGRLTLGLMGSFGPLVRSAPFAPMVRASEASKLATNAARAARKAKRFRPFGGYRHTDERGAREWAALEAQAERAASERRAKERARRYQSRMSRLAIILHLVWVALALANVWHMGV